MTTNAEIEGMSPIQVMEAWHDSIHRGNTRDNYRWRINTMARFLGCSTEVFMREFIADAESTSDRVLEAAIQRDMADKTIRGLCESQRHLAKWLFEHGVYRSCPYVKLPQLRRRNWMDRPVGVTKQEVQRIKEYIETLPRDRRIADKALLECLYPWGLRRHEIMSLCTGWVGESSVRIVEKGAKRAIEIPASQRAIEALKALVEVNRAHGPVFDETPVFQSPGLYRPNKWRRTLPGTNVATFKAWVDSWGEAIGSKLTPHKFRHGSITLARDLGVPVADAANLFRHSYDMMQRIYDDKPGTRALAAVDKMYADLDAKVRAKKEKAELFEDDLDEDEE